MGILFVFGTALFFLLALFSWQSWAHTHSRGLIERWAARNGFRLLRAEITTLATTLFPSSVKGQVVWMVRLERPDGTREDAWLRCGGTALGYHLDEVDVRWAGPGRSAFF